MVGFADGFETLGNQLTTSGYFQYMLVRTLLNTLNNFIPPLFTHIIIIHMTLLRDLARVRIRAGN